MTGRATSLLPRATGCARLARADCRGNGRAERLERGNPRDLRGFQVPLRDGRLAHDPLEEPHETNFVETVTGGWRIEGYDDWSHVASFKVSPRSFLP
jgi:hypothetical protein